MENKYYLRDEQQHANPPKFPDPPIDRCALSSDIVRGNTNQILLPNNGVVLIKIASPTTYDNAYHLVSNSGNDHTSSGNHANDDEDNDTRIEHAYLYEPTDECLIFKSKYGNVYRGKVLQCQRGVADWKWTSEVCAIKVMPWRKIIVGQEEGRIKNPRTEIVVMHLLKSCYDDDETRTAREIMRETNTIVSLDIFFDDSNLYSIMPYCDGGEIFGDGVRFTEEECRTEIMPQILNGFEWLQKAKICHRDISLENLMLDGEGDQMKVIIINFGMALRILYAKDGTRQLISAQHRCGKGPYMSPEIYQSGPFNGHAVDLWATGVIIFVLITRFHPWEY